jgi:uncharacterized membrane protein
MRRIPFFQFAAVGLSTLASAGTTAEKYQVVTPKDDGIIATGINERGDVIGFEWIEDPAHPGVMNQVPFYAKGKEMTYLPLLTGYTATSPAAVSDDGLVVGRASKPGRPGVRVPLRNQAFVWTARAGIRGLGALEGDSASLACGISRDGRRISGYSIGDDRMRACVWNRDGEGWKGVALPHAARLGSSTVAISGDGRFIAAVDGTEPCLWSEDASGRWTRERLGDAGSLVPRAVNDKGTIAGVRLTPDGLTHAVIWSRPGGLQLLPKPQSYVRSEAFAINNHGVVVGMVDGPGGSKIGPSAFVYTGGHLRLLDEGGPSFGSATAINDRGQVAGVIEKEEAEAVDPPDPDQRGQAPEHRAAAPGKSSLASLPGDRR